MTKATPIPKTPAPPRSRGARDARDSIAPCKQCDGGSVYIAVLGAAIIVTVIGLSALLVARVQQRSASGTSHFAKARLNAQSAVEMGLFLIKQNPTTWRSDFAAGVIPTNQPLGKEGSFSLEAVDPVDGSLTNNSTDPVLLIGIGYAGQARYKLQVQLTPDGALQPGTWRRAP